MKSSELDLDDLKSTDAETAILDTVAKGSEALSPEELDQDVSDPFILNFRARSLQFTKELTTINAEIESETVALATESKTLESFRGILASELGKLGTISPSLRRVVLD